MEDVELDLFREILEELQTIHALLAKLTRNGTDSIDDILSHLDSIDTKVGDVIEEIANK
jgi:hypothetical protein